MKTTKYTTYDTACLGCGMRFAIEIKDVVGSTAVGRCPDPTTARCLHPQSVKLIESRNTGGVGWAYIQSFYRRFVNPACAGWGERRGG